MSNSHLHTITLILYLLMAHKRAKSQYFRKFSYLHIYQVLEEFPTYMIIRTCTFIELGVIFLSPRLFGHHDYSAQQSISKLLKNRKGSYFKTNVNMVGWHPKC